MKKILSAITIACFLASISIGSSASAESLSISSTIESVVPDVYSQTAESQEVSVSLDTSTETVSIRDVGNGEENSEVSLEIPNVTGSSVGGDGLISLSGTDVGIQQVLQPLRSGFRILNLTLTPESPNTFEYKLDLPDGAHAENVLGTIRVSKGDEILGSIKEPWAVDSDGKIVKTFFTLNGDVVTQHVETTGDESFPIVSDPNWGYVGVWSLNANYKISWERLHNCFNCYFPVDGAPSHWPAYNELLPLRVFPSFNMECRMGYVFTATTYYRWKFLATKNHLDGLGSNIIFDLRKTTTGENQLVVDAWIVNDVAWPGGNEAYELMARLNWYHFAVHLNTY